MKIVRRFFGVLVMLAGILGLLLSLAGLAAVWVGKSTVAASAGTTIELLNRSVVTSQGVMDTTVRALGATVDSVDELSAMLSTTAATLEDTKPALDGFNKMMATTLPATLNSATDSLQAAQQAAQVLEGTMQSLQSFQVLLADAPLIGDLVPKSTSSYSPGVPLADSLGELATSLQGLPEDLAGISVSLSTTGTKLTSVQESLVTMSESVKVVSSSLGEYETMVGQSRASMGNLTSMLSGVQKNLGTILNGAAIGLTLFFVWLLAAQVVILSQGWEIYRGTADRIEK